MRIGPRRVGGGGVMDGGEMQRQQGLSLTQPYFLFFLDTRMCLGDSLDWE